jgi:hypothetical protein
MAVIWASFDFSILTLSAKVQQRHNGAWTKKNPVPKHRVETNPVEGLEEETSKN